MKSSHKLFIIGLFIISGLCGILFSVYTHHDSVTEPTHLREDQVTHSPVTFVEQIKGDPDAGRKIYKEFCAACHAPKPLVDVDAPRVGQTQVWKKLYRKGMPALLKTTSDGVATMPTRGGCFECSDEQLVEAIQYILRESRVIP